MLNERENIPALLSCLSKQKTTFRYKAIICVNQPDSWWQNPDKVHICENNQKSIDFLRKQNLIDITVIDKSTKGWNEKHYGVGWARKIAMDAANDQAKADDFIFMMDADTFYPENYLQQTTENLLQQSNALGIAVPYFHRLPDDQAEARAILRYEFYMRHYALNMWRIGSPYRFTAVGSAIVIPVWAYRKVGGITPKIAGEDFYFLQKLRKSGELVCSNPVKAFPTARTSDRVIFGTGPAMSKGISGDWNSYPIYHPTCFDDLKKIYLFFADYYQNSSATESLLTEVFPDNHWLKKIKANATTKSQFVQQCHVKFDGLKTIQFLKKRQELITKPQEQILAEYLLEKHPDKAKIIETALINLDFKQSTIHELNVIRDVMVATEDEILTNNPVISW